MDDFAIKVPADPADLIGDRITTRSCGRWVNATIMAVVGHIQPGDKNLILDHRECIPGGEFTSAVFQIAFDDGHVGERFAEELYPLGKLPPEIHAVNQSTFSPVTILVVTNGLRVMRSYRYVRPDWPDFTTVAVNQVRDVTRALLVHPEFDLVVLHCRPAGNYTMPARMCQQLRDGGFTGGIALVTHPVSELARIAFKKKRVIVARDTRHLFRNEGPMQDYLDWAAKMRHNGA